MNTVGETVSSGKSNVLISNHALTSLLTYLMTAVYLCFNEYENMHKLSLRSIVSQFAPFLGETCPLVQSIHHF